MRKLGRDLVKGDNIKVWWRPNVDRIVEIRPYRGPYETTILQGAQSAVFAILKTGMTIVADDWYEIVD